MISIQRDQETKDLVVMLVINGIASYIKIPPGDAGLSNTKQMIGSAASFYGKSWDKYTDRFQYLYDTLLKLSKERKRRVLNIPKTTEIKPEFKCMYDHIVSGGLLTLEEVYFVDWFLRKHKLNG